MYGPWTLRSKTYLYPIERQQSMCLQDTWWTESGGLMTLNTFDGRRRSQTHLAELEALREKSIETYDLFCVLV
jgi:hypothetical protein